MIRLLFIVLALFGLYVALGQYAPFASVVFQKGFFIPTTQIYLSYVTAIMLVVAAYLFARVSLK